MNDFIQMAMQQLGTDESTTRSVTGKVLGFIKEKASGTDVTQLMDKLPGASQLAEASAQAPAPEKKASGGLGGFVSQAGAALGGSLGSSMDLAGGLTQSGLSMGKIGPFVAMFVSYIKEKAGGDLVGRILGQVPDLKKLAG